MFKKVIIRFAVFALLTSVFTTCQMQEDIAPTYIVHFNANGGTGTMQDTTLKYHHMDVLPLCSFVPPDNCSSFVSWNTKTDGTGIDYYLGKSYEDLTTDPEITLYAEWGNMVTFDSKGGSAVKSLFVPYGKVIPQMDTPTLNGCDFIGWFKSNGEQWNIFNDIVTEDIILYASWYDPSALLANTIEFETSDPINKIYGDAPFVNAIKTGSLGTGAINYTSSNETVAIVNNSGLITILKAGTTIITCTKATDGTYAQADAQYTITVDRASPGTPNPPRLDITNETSGTITLRAPLNADPSFVLEYARSTFDSPPQIGWQTNLDFSGLESQINYYFFARYKEDLNKNYESDASASLVATTSSGLLPRTIEFETADLINKNYGDAPFTNPVIQGSPGAGTISYTSSNTAIATIVSNSGQVTILKAGSTVITATRASDGTYIQASAQYTLQVGLATPDAPNPPRFGSSNPNSVTLVEPLDANTTQFILEYAYDTSFTPPSTGWQDSKTFNNLNADTSYMFFARYKTVPEKNNVSPASQSLIANTSSLLSRSISFDTTGPVNKNYGDPDFINAVRSGSAGGGGISYYSDSGTVATVNETTGQVTILKAGTANISATKESDGTYAQATVLYTLQINLASPAAPNPPRLASSSTNSVTLDDPIGANTTQFTLEFASNTSDSAPASGWQDSKVFNGLAANTGYFFFARYKAVSEKNYVSAASGSLSASTSLLQSRTITFVNGSQINKIYEDAPFTNAVASGSLGGGAISYSSGDTTIATVDSASGLVTIVKAGTVTITARKEADGTYALVTASYTLQISLASPAAPASPGLASSSQTSITLSKPAGVSTLFALEYARNSSSSAPTTGWQDSLAFSGLSANTSYYFFARYKADLNYNNVSAASTGVLFTTSILSSNSIAFTTTGTITKTYGDPAFTNTLSNSGLGGGTVSYTSSVTTVATVNSSSGLITIVKPGTTVITVTKASDGIYALATASFTLTINTKGVTITGLIPTANKIYDRSTSAAVTGTAVVSGLVSGETVTITTGNANYDDKNVGTNKTITFSGYSISGTYAVNYTLLSQPAGITNGSITQKGLTITGVTASGKVYDGNTTAAFSGGSLSGVITGDSVSFTTGTGTFALKDIGSRAVTFSGFALSGTDKDNYYLSSQPANSSATITVKSITLTVGTPGILSPVSYAQGFTVSSSGFVSGDTPTLTVAVASLSTYGLTLSNETGVNNVASKTVTLNYNGTTAVTNTAAVNLGLTISGNTNYSLSGTASVSVTIRDGATTTRAIPVNSSNYSYFNTYANTAAGLGKSYIQTTDISVSGIINNWPAIGTQAAPFTGNYNGSGYRFSGLQMYYQDVGTAYSSYQGVFGYIKGANCVIENLGLYNSTIRGSSYVGGLVGYNDGATIRNCWVTTNSPSFYGISAYPNIPNDTYYTSYAGGLVGYNKGLVENCYNRGLQVSSGGTDAADYLGGIVGYNDTNGKIQFCYATGEIDGRRYIGGIAGYSTGTITSCVAMNSKLMADYATYMGRVVGGTSGGTLSKNYADSNMQFTVYNGAAYAPLTIASLTTKEGGTNYDTTQTFWQTTVGFTFTVLSGQTVLASGAWYWSGNPPTLYGMEN
ncbi:MAG: YDG domain-containing protein [Treponema sp.]|nr:YDG domain-containing protein [Treponema sp.]